MVLFISCCFSLTPFDFLDFNKQKSVLVLLKKALWIPVLQECV